MKLGIIEQCEYEGYEILIIRTEPGCFRAEIRKDGNSKGLTAHVARKRRAWKDAIAFISVYLIAKEQQGERAGTG